MTRQVISTPGTGSFTVPDGVFSLTTRAIAGGNPGQPGAEDDENPGFTGTAGDGGTAGGCGVKTLACTPGQILYYRVGAAGQTTWFNLGTNSEAAGAGGYSVGQGSTRTPATGQSFDAGYNGGTGGAAYNGGSVLTTKAGGGGGGGGSAGNGGPGTSGTAGAHGVGGTGGAGTGGLDSGGAGGDAFVTGSAPGGGGGGGTLGSGEGAGAAGQLSITYSVANEIDVDAQTLPYQAGNVAFLHQGITPVTAQALAFTGGNIAFSGAMRTEVTAQALSFVGGDISFSTSGGAPGSGTTVLPNQQASARRIATDITAMRFRNADSTQVRTAKLEVLRSATASSALGVSTRTALAMRTTGTNALAFLTEAGREGLFLWSAADLSGRVAADPNKGLYVPPSSDPSGATGAWVRMYEGPIKPEWFGTVANSAGAATTNVAAWAAMMTALAAIAYIPVANYLGMPKVEYEAAEYHYASDLDIDKGSIDISGSGAGVVATKLKFAANSSGLRFQYYESSGTSGGAVAPHENSAGSSLRNIIIEGSYVAGVSAEGEYHGVVIRAPTYLENVQVQYFQGDGYYVVAGAVSGTNRGNANLFRMVNCVGRFCRNGIQLGGADANAYNIEGGSFDNNRQWGHFEPDPASLGGNVRGTHYDVNGVSGIAGIPATVVSYLGNWYSCIHGQESWCSTNAPTGTTASNQGWAYLGAGGAMAGYPAWASGGDYRSGGSVLSKSPNAVTKFDGCYSEPGQGNPQLDSPNWIVGGGLGGRPVVGTGGALIPLSGYLTSTMSLKTKGYFDAEGALHAIGQHTSTGSINELELRSPEGFGTLRWGFYVNGVRSYTTCSITAWHNGAAAGAIYSALDKHFFKTGGGTYDSSTLQVTIDADGIDMEAGNSIRVAGVPIISSDAYGVGWNGVTTRAPSMDAVYDKIESLATAGKPIRTATTTAQAVVTLADSDGTVLCNATSGAITVALPAAASSTGMRVNIKKIDSSANAVTVDANGAELIDGAATWSLPAQWDGVTLHCDGTAWYVL